MALELHAPISPTEWHAGWSWWQWSLPLVALLLLLLAAAWLWRTCFRHRMRKGKHKRVSRALLTRSALQQLAVEQVCCSEIALRCSELLRGYIDDTYGECTSYQTNSEFNNDANSLANLPSAARLAARELLSNLDEYKYSGMGSNPLLAEQFIAQSLQLLQQLEVADIKQK